MQLSLGNFLCYIASRIKNRDLCDSVLANLTDQVFYCFEAVTTASSTSKYQFENINFATLLRAAESMKPGENFICFI